MLAAYSLGMPALFVDRIVSSSFLARGDTATPLKVTLVGVALNVASRSRSTSRSARQAWRSRPPPASGSRLLGVFTLAFRRGWAVPDARFLATAAATLFACGALALALTLANAPLISALMHLPRFARETRLLILAFDRNCGLFPGAGVRPRADRRRADGDGREGDADATARALSAQRFGDLVRSSPWEQFRGDLAIACRIAAEGVFSRT